MDRRHFLIAAGAALSAARGYGASANGASPESDLRVTPIEPTDTQTAPASKMEPAQPLPTNRYLRRVTELAMADLAARLDLPVERIEFLELKAVVWPDGGMGCPRSGMVYPQVQVDGYLIRLRAGKREFPYHGGGDKPPFLCENGG